MVGTLARVVCLIVSACACTTTRAPNDALVDANDRNCAFNRGDRANLRMAPSVVPHRNLIESGRTRVVIIVADSASLRDARNALVRFTGRDTVMKATDDAGRATVELRAPGSYRLLVRHILFRQTVDTVSVRAGYEDTLFVGLHAGRQCLSRLANR